MKVILQKNRIYVLKFETGEKYPEVFIRFLKNKKIRGGFFVGLGACVDPEISFYDLKKKKYTTRKFRGDFEVLNLTGNIAVSGGKIIIHQHVALGDKNFRATGGHLQKTSIGGTLEIFLTPMPALARKVDRNTGLNLLQC